MNDIITEDDIVGGQAFIDEFVRRKDLSKEVELSDEQVKTLKGFKMLVKELQNSKVKLITVGETHLGFIQGYDSQTFVDKVNHIKSDTWKSLLVLGGNNIGVEGAKAIAENLTSLTTLNLDDNKIGVEGAKAIAENLTSLTTLYLGGNNIGVEGAKAIAENLTSLTTLDLRYNNIGDEGAKAIAENLKSLTALYLESNKIGDEGAVAIAENLMSLTDLGLWDNNIGVEGAKAIAENLKSLTALGLRDNNIGDEGAKAIAENLKSLTDLRLGSNKIGFKSRLAMLKILVQQDRLEKQFSIINLEKENAMALVNVWKTDPMQRYFDIPEDIFKAGPAAITSYGNQLSKGFRYEVKVLVLGEGEAGKTSLIRTILNNGASILTGKVDRTVGIEMLEWEIKNPSNKSKAPVYVNFHDFGGQLSYHQLHRLFISDESPSMIVFDLSKFEEDQYVKRSIIYYIEAVRLEVKKPKFILIGTHSKTIYAKKHDEVKKNIVAQLNEYEQIRSIREKKEVEGSRGYEEDEMIEIDWSNVQMFFIDYSKNGWFFKSKLKGEKKLIPYLEQLFVESKQELPTSYSALLKSMRETGFWILDLKDINTVALGSTKLEDLETALIRLRNTGRVLYYPENEELKNKVFPSPEIVINYLKWLFYHEKDKAFKFLERDEPESFRNVQLYGILHQSNLKRLISWENLRSFLKGEEKKNLRKQDISDIDFKYFLELIRLMSIAHAQGEELFIPSLINQTTDNNVFNPREENVFVSKIWTFSYYFPPGMLYSSLIRFTHFRWKKETTSNNLINVQRLVMLTKEVGLCFLKEFKWNEISFLIAFYNNNKSIENDRLTLSIIIKNKNPDEVTEEDASVLFEVWNVYRKIVDDLIQDKKIKKNAIVQNWNKSANSLVSFFWERVMSTPGQYMYLEESLNGQSKDESIPKWRLIGPMKAKGYLAFLSYHQAGTGNATSELRKDLLKLLKEKNDQSDIFQDTEHLLKLKDIPGHVKVSKVLVLMLSKELFSRPYCLVEMKCAMDEKIPILPIQIHDNIHQSGFNRREAYEYLSKLSIETLNNANPTAWNDLEKSGAFQNQQQLIDLGEFLCENLKDIISPTYELTNEKNLTYESGNANKILGRIETLADQIIWYQS